MTTNSIMNVFEKVKQLTITNQSGLKEELDPTEELDLYSHLTHEQKLELSQPSSVDIVRPLLCFSKCVWAYIEEINSWIHVSNRGEEYDPFISITKDSVEYILRNHDLKLFKLYTTNP